MARRITRRSFLVAAGAAATTATGGFALGRITATSGEPERRPDRDPAERHDAPEVAAVRRLFLDSDGPRHLGGVYLESDASTPALRPGYLPEGFVPSEAPSGDEWLVSASRREMAIRTMLLARSDFDSGRVVDVGGWRIARSTAELCAVLARGS